MRGRKADTFGRKQAAAALRRVFPTLDEGTAVGVVDTVFGAILQALGNGQQVTISGFGTFVVRVRKAYEARDPSKGCKITVPERRTVRFKPGRMLKETLDEIT